MRRQRRGHIEHQRDAAREQIRDGLIAAALIGNHGNPGARLGVEQFGRHVTRRCVAGRAEGQAFGLALRQRDQLPQIIRRDRGMRHQHVGHNAEQRDRRHVFAEIETRFGLRRVERVGDRRHEKGVTVGGRARHGFGGDHAAVARAIFHHDRLAEAGLHPLADQPGQDVRRRAGPETDHDLDRLGGIGLRHDGAGTRDRYHDNGCAKRSQLEGATEQDFPPEHTIPAVHSAFGFVDARGRQPYSWDDSSRSARPKAGPR